MLWMVNIYMDESHTTTHWLVDLDTYCNTLTNDTELPITRTECCCAVVVGLAGYKCVSVTVTFTLLFAVTSAVANCQSFIPYFIRKSSAKGIVGELMDSQKRKKKQCP